MEQKYIELLNNTPLFGGIRLETIDAMLSHANIVEKTQNQYFFKENELADSMFILLSGQVEVQKMWRDKPYLITQLLEGDCFGEMAIIDHCARSANVIALTHCEAVELNIDSFSKIYTQDIKQYTMLQMNMGREISRRLRQANDLLFQSKIENDIKNNAYQHTIKE